MLKKDRSLLNIVDVACGISSAGVVEPDLATKIFTLINENKAVYCLVELEELHIFKSMEEFKTKIKKNKGERYYDGEFLNDDVYLYWYEKTVRASEATKHDFHLRLNHVNIDTMFQHSTYALLFQIDVDL